MIKNVKKQSFFFKVLFYNDLKLCKKNIFKRVNTFRNNECTHLNASLCI